MRGTVWLVVATDRNVAKMRTGGRFSGAPDTKQQEDLAARHATTILVLMLLRQNGLQAPGWRDLSSWWPDINICRGDSGY